MENKTLYASASSVVVVGLITFVGDSSRGLIYPALWPLCKSLGGTQVDLGWLTATFSIGRLVTSVQLGKLADIYRHRKTLIFSNIIMMFGALLWACAPVIGGLPALYAGQFFMGIGTGFLGVVRSYIVEQTDPANRTYALARLSSLQFAGFSMTPIFGAILVIIGGTRSSGSSSSKWQYSLPAIMVVFLGLLCMTLLIFVFQDIKEDINFSSTTATDAKSIDNTKASTASTVTDVVNSNRLLSPSLCEGYNNESISNNIESKGDVWSPLHIADVSDTAITSTTTPITKSQNIHDIRNGTNMNKMPNYFRNCCRPTSSDQLDSETATDLQIVYVLMMCLNFTTRGAIAVYETQSAQLILGTYKFGELALGAVVTTAGCMGTFNLVFFKQIWVKNFSDIQLMLGGFALMGIPQFLSMHFGKTDYVKAWRFLLPLYLMYGFGYPIGNSAVLGAFSMLQKSGRQASAQGQFALMGSLARVILPIISGYFEFYVEESSSFSMVLVLMSASSIAVLFHYDKILYFTIGSKTSMTNRNPPFLLSHFTLMIFWLLIATIGMFTIFDVGLF